MGDTNITDTQRRLGYSLDCDRTHNLLLREFMLLEQTIANIKANLARGDAPPAALGTQLVTDAERVSRQIVALDTMDHLRWLLPPEPKGNTS